jgi:hypothetical protein
MPRVSPPPLTPESSCVARTKADLQRLRAFDTPEGQAALALAAGIDSGRALMALPAMTRELRATLTEIRERAPKSGDSVDEFTAKRAARRASRTA